MHHKRPGPNLGVPPRIEVDKHGRWVLVLNDGTRVKVKAPLLAPSVRRPARVILGPAKRTVTQARAEAKKRGTLGTASGSSVPETVLRRGTKLCHGTQVVGFTHPTGPAWFTTDAAVCSSVARAPFNRPRAFTRKKVNLAIATVGGKPGNKGWTTGLSATGRVLWYRVARSKRLLDLSSVNDCHALEQALFTPEEVEQRQRGRGTWTCGADIDLPRRVCRRYAGWRMGPEVMLCSPSKVLKAIGKPKPPPPKRPA